MRKSLSAARILHATLACLLFAVSLALATPQTVTTEIVIGANPYSQGVEVTVGSFEGTVLGTGSDGTTYVLSRTSEKMTIVEDSTHLSAHAVVITGSITMVDDFQCAFDKDQDSVACTDSIVLADSVTTTIMTEEESGRILELSVPIATSTGSTSSTSSAGRSQWQTTQSYFMAVSSFLFLFISIF